HPNIATLHYTLETSAFLLLLFEYVPGEDLFYFLEQAWDHYDDSISGELTTNRLRLITSVFSQMCEAVATCHDQQTFHRDIEPENFIAAEGWTASTNGKRKRKLVVKLTDFGLSTDNLGSSDMGNRPGLRFLDQPIERFM
ncbi:kinase-like protein, partial [Athelia psychrophila]